jgi:hypothetical protein
VAETVTIKSRRDRGGTAPLLATAPTLRAADNPTLSDGRERLAAHWDDAREHVIRALRGGQAVADRR